MKSRNFYITTMGHIKTIRYNSFWAEIELLGEWEDSAPEFISNSSSYFKRNWCVAFTGGLKDFFGLVGSVAP